MLFRYYKSDFLKTKHSSIRAAHLFIPILAALIFSAYYSYAHWDDYVKVDIYFTAAVILILLKFRRDKKSQIILRLRKLPFRWYVP